MQAAVKQQLAADGRAWDSNCPLPGISIENVPQFEYNSVYLPAGEANGWPRFVRFCKIDTHSEYVPCRSSDRHA